MATPEIPGTVISFDLDVEDNKTLDKGSTTPGSENGYPTIHNSPTTTVIDMRALEDGGECCYSDREWQLRGTEYICTLYVSTFDTICNSLVDY